MRNRTFTIKGVHIPCKRVPKTPFVIATIARKEAKFTVYGKDVTLVEGEIPDLVVGELMGHISNYFSNSLTVQSDL